MLCGVCIGVLQHRANLITNEPGDDGPRTMCAHHRTTRTLEKSAAEGCYICHTFWIQLSEHEQEALRAAELRRSVEKEPHASAETPEHLLEWLTLTILQQNSISGGGFMLMLSFSGEGIDWKSVSPKHYLALGLFVSQPVSG